MRLKLGKSKASWLDLVSTAAAEGARDTQRTVRHSKSFLLVFFCSRVKLDTIDIFLATLYLRIWPLADLKSALLISREQQFKHGVRVWFGLWWTSLEFIVTSSGLYKTKTKGHGSTLEETRPDHAIYYQITLCCVIMKTRRGWGWWRTANRSNAGGFFKKL